jgi:hypothetical protein
MKGSGVRVPASALTKALQTVRIAPLANRRIVVNLGSRAPRSMRPIAVELSLTNMSGETISSDANSDSVVIGTDGQSYTFALGVERKGCSDFAYGSFTLSAGAHDVGCVVYELPTGVQVAKVQWGLNGEVETTRLF